jgi:leucyl aminopeptidase
MDIRCIQQELGQALKSWDGDTLAVGLFATEAEGLDHPLRQELSRCFGEALPERLEQRGFHGKASECVSFARLEGNPANLIVVGLGERAAFDLTALRGSAATAAMAAAKLRCCHLGLALPCEGFDGAAAATAMAEAVQLSLYRDQRFRSEPDKEPAPQALSLIGLAEGAQAGLDGVAARCAGVELARQLVAAPPNVATPAHLADTAAAIASAFSLELKVLERSDCEALGMGAYLGVAKASELPPKFIHLTYKPAGTPTRKLAIVGKGLTFDSGGLNIKVTGSGIEMMKIDMGGAAATLGAAKAIAQLKPSAEVHFISAATENMISGRALRPGDILTASNGKTIEVNNTDAEGRLTLADALVFAEKLGVDAIVDLATLTGACIVALGDDIAGLFTENEDLAAAIATAATAAGEKFWRLPMEEKYFDGLKSIVADMKNTGPRPGGSITAALFLKQFVTSTPWVHLDVAGPVWTEKENGYNNPGGTGFGVRTLVQWVLATA